MNEREQKVLVDAIADALAERGTADGSRLLDLMRAEQNLVDALAVVRREIQVIVRSSREPAAGS